MSVSTTMLADTLPLSIPKLDPTGANWGHFDGTSTVPTVSNPPTLLTQKLPDSIMVLIHLKMSVKERWDEVVKEYMLKSEYAKTGLRAKFLSMRCGDKGSVREFLEGLRLKKEELSQARVNIDENTYFSVITSASYFKF